jgi:GT2 family glycosyltransferase
MWVPHRVIELELSEPLPDFAPFEGCRAVQALLTWNGVPCGWHELPLAGLRLATSRLIDGFLDEHFKSIASRLLREHLLAGNLPEIEAFFATAPRPPAPTKLPGGPSVSVVVCTRNRPDDLRRCVRTLCDLKPAPLEIVVVDNAPADESSRQVVGGLPLVRYVVETRPGLSWARNRGTIECRGDVIAFVDDDVTVDRRWVGRLQEAFAENPAVGAVTGLVCPGELETSAQAQFETHGGFGRGFQPKHVHPARGRRRLDWRACETGRLGTGANMAFRRTVLERVGLFAPELGAGTPAEGGEDLEMLYRIIKHGIPVVYEPRALAWHRHRREPEALVRQMHGWGVGFLAYVNHVRRLFAEEALNLRRFELYWLAVLFKRVIGGVLLPGRGPSRLQWQQFVGAVVARRRYREARARACEIEAKHGPLVDPRFPQPQAAVPSARGSRPNAVAVRAVDLAQGVQGLDGLTAHDRTRVSVSANGRYLADVDVENRGLDISRDRMINSVLEHRPAEDWLALARGIPVAQASAALREDLRRRILPGLDDHPDEQLPDTVPISVLLVARRTTVDLRRQLAALDAVAKPRPFEVIVLPQVTGLDLSSLEAEFPGLRCHTAIEPGVSAALNVGARMTTHDIVVCTTDEVAPDDQWVRRLLAPFGRNDIDVVCGRVLPATSRSATGDTRGGDSDLAAVEFGARWFYSRRLSPLPVQVWGATANLAFRKQVLADVEVGGFDPALGPGVPSGDGETGYLFYRALRHGYKLRYQPDAVTWYQRAGTRAELIKRHFEIGKGYVAGHLHMLLKDGDFRAWGRLCALPRVHASRLVSSIAAHDHAVPPMAILAELAGNLLGAYSLWKSYRQLKEPHAAAPA